MDEVGILMVAPLNKYIDDGMNLVESNGNLLGGRLYVCIVDKASEKFMALSVSCHITESGHFSPFSLPRVDRESLGISKASLQPNNR